MFNKTLACLAFATAPCSALAAQAKVNADPTAFIGFLVVVGLVIAGFGAKIWFNEKNRRKPRPGYRGHAAAGLSLTVVLCTCGLPCAIIRGINAVVVHGMRGPDIKPRLVRLPCSGVIRLTNYGVSSAAM